jgi:phage/plasmid-associated DNA primase
MSFDRMVRIGITFPKEKVKLPIGWNKFTQSQYNNEKNFAVLTGKVNNIVVIDLDNKEETFKGLTWFENKFGEIDKVSTLVTKTIRNGYHVYFKYNENIKSKINWNGMNIDILSDDRCCYEGEGYDIVRNEKIRELSEEELELFNENKQQVVCYKKVNTLLNQPNDTTWDIERQDKGIKAVPNCKKCLLNPCKEHSQEKHSALYINNDKTVIKTCFSCGSDVLDKRESKKIFNVFNVIMNIKDVETTMYQQLVKELVDLSKEGNYKREKGSGIVYKQVKSYAYVKYKSPMDFLNEVFYGDVDFKSHVQNMDNLVKFMKQYDDPSFPFLEYCKDYIGFRNGVLNVVTCNFDQNPEGIVVKKYIDQEFIGSIETPLMDKVLDYQFSAEVRDFIYGCLGRLFGIRDNWGFMLYLLGEAGCGKSLILDVVSECFNNVGAIGDSYETKYGLSYLYDKDIVICDDLPKDIHKIFPQQAFQTIITGGKIPTAVKNGDALTIEWKTPLLFAGNWLPSYLDKGQISRRIMVANFEKNVYEPDTTLKQKIIDTELPAFILKCLIFYKNLRDNNPYKGIWQICPEYFLEQQEELRTERNPLYKFLLENTRYKKDNMIKIEDIKINFNNWLGKKVSKLDNGTFGQVNKDYIIMEMKTCKHCENEAKKGCCGKYNNKDRTRKKWVKNIEICGTD